MTRTYPVSIFTVLILLLFTRIAPGQSERFFPESTKGYFSISNLHDFIDRLDKTSIGDLQREPEAKEFFASFVKQIKLRVQKKSKVSLGLSLDELKGMVDGEVAIGLVQPKENLLAVITLAEYSEAKKVDAALAKIEKNLMKETDPEKKVKRVEEITESGLTVVHYEFPDPFGIAGPPQVFYGKTDKYVVSYHGPVLDKTKKADHVVEVKKLLRALAGEKQPSLAERDVFKTIMKKVVDNDKYKGYQTKWFIESFGFVDAAKKVWPDQLKDVQVGSFRKVGFDAIKAGGGIGMVSPGETEFQIRAFLYAPPVDEKNRFLKAAKMLDFTADMNRLKELPVWAAQSTSTYLAAHIRMLKAFDSAEPLIDELYGEGTMGQILDNFKTNPKLKANFDLRNHFFANLADRVIAIRDPKFPAKPGNNRVVFAMDVKGDAKKVALVAKVVAGYMANEDPNFVEKIEHKVGKEVITIFKKTLPIEDPDGKPGDLDLDELDLDDLNDELEPKAKAADDGKNPLIKYYCVTQYKGQVLFSPDMEFLKQVIDRSVNAKKAMLAEENWYRRVNAGLDKVKNSSFESLRYVIRLDLPYKAAFQLIKESDGDLPVEKMVKKLLKEDEKTRLYDISKLPKDFDKSIAPHLGFIGWSMTTEKDGWMYNGIVLRKNGSQTKVEE